MSKKYKLAIVISRRQIKHKGHDILDNAALDVADNVLEIIGSAFKFPDSVNLFSWECRKDFTINNLNISDRNRIAFRPIRDYYNIVKWTIEVERIVWEFCREKNIEIVNEYDEIVLIGHKKLGNDDTNYLDVFKQWSYLSVVSNIKISATELRNIYFSNNIFTKIFGYFKLKNNVDPWMFEYLMSWKHSSEYARIAKDHNYIIKEKKKWSKAPYPNLAQTADCLVTCGDFILIGERKNYGKGSWCIPGGYVNEYEEILDAGIRELFEETNLDISKELLLKVLKSTHNYSHPKRSARGRIITTLFHFDLEYKNDYELPFIEANDDLAAVIWLSRKTFLETENRFFEDHHNNVCDVLKLDRVLKLYLLK